MVGDSENDENILSADYKKIIELINTSGVKFLIHVGDFTNRGEKMEYDKFKNYMETSLTIPYNMVVGNHDIIQDPSNKTLFKEYYGNPFRSFDDAGTHFVLLDNANPQIGFSEEELAWLRFDLEQNKDKKIFLFFHRPIDVPYVQYFSIPAEESVEAQQRNEEFKKIINDYPIEEIYTGHLHSYFSYTLINKIPLTITGGGGSTPNLSFLDNARSFIHFIKTEVNGQGHYNEIVEIN